MNYVQIYLKGVRDLYTWESQSSVNLGDRVEVRFRRRLKIGLVVGIGETKPDFATKPLEKIIHRNFIPAASVKLAKAIAEKHFCRVGKVLSLMIPDKFFARVNPVEREKVLQVSVIGYQSPDIRGSKQRALLEALEKEKLLRYEKAKAIASTATINTLVRKGVIEIREEGITSIFKRQSSIFNKGDIVLTPDQQKALEAIEQSEKPTLLFGVTGSGKTEVYKKLAALQLSSAQVLVLVPEIALTSQLIQSFQQAFGMQISVWHSRMSAGEKIQEWARIQSGEATVVIGTRSAILIPIPRLRLVIVDEEHEWTYKNEFAPRFWVREVIEQISDIKYQISGKKDLKVVYGSATPSTESWHQVKEERWNLVKLEQKASAQLENLETGELKNEIQIVDLRQEIKRGNDTPISDRLYRDMKRVLREGQQVVLFLNRRGFANITLCQHCGHQFECLHCSHFMKLHTGGTLVCHICGHMEKMPGACPECQKTQFQWKGWGTQRLEPLLEEYFPEKKVLRADRDSVSGKYDFDALMEKFHAGTGDILLGTQMITKGLDFDNVGLVGIILADIGLSLPDFRSQERVFQQLVQVAGRTGRRDNRGEILIQTFHPDLELFESVRRHDVEGFLAKSLLERKESQMPPFAALAKLLISDVSKEKAWMKTQQIYKEIQKRLSDGKYQLSDDRRADPCSLVSDICEVHWAPAFWPRMHGQYHFHIFIKGRDEESLVKFLKTFDLESVKVDLSPVSLL